MSLIVPNSGEILLHTFALTHEDLTLKLYKNDYTPTATSVVGNFTEADFTGYSAATLDKDDWTIVTDGNSKASATNDAQSWTAASTQTVYGYYVLSTSSATTVLWAERFGVARALTSGDQLTITPTITASSEN